MRIFGSVSALAVVLLAGTALAQGTGPSHRQPDRVRRSGEQPLDRGPFTPEASRAFRGGGVVLEGEPGGPAPAPRALPPEAPPPR